MTLSLRTHWHKQGKSDDEVIVRTSHYVRLMAADQSPIFIQGGRFYYQGGTAVDFKDLPDWVGDEIAKMTPEARRAVGLK